MKHLLIAAITLLAIATTPARAETSSHSLPLYTTIEHQPQSATLAALAPEADPEVLSLALAAMRCAQAHGVGTSAHRLAVIDYSRSSLTPRLWVFDLARNQLLFHLLVAHGQGSGGDIPQHFSNAEGSHASSLGLFHTLNTYQGSNGYSLRMEGLEPGFNDAAYSRAIVMHGAGYVNANAGQQMGRLGRSWGCPAVRNAMARPVIDVLKDGQFLFAYYPEQKWLMRSSLAQCAQARVRRKQEEATRLASSR
ncbi:murein L,D-transpeptidase catalytic domain family protein [Kushneria phosphatilytica]|uniref:Murein L,D-transpeptidase catalytic domain family protein n=1 Tax=Kushneria phosphatilytica TaxID=657387 RepID=A0A5C1A0Y6_9GAMM|nr:murein L,D-transpeptidase catalytic domain family protein [Kushneria phosphatilytica]QEL11724.1 murein L,D-transpeptidase catalytic domain family protein [Kushneria phosphatilytica]